MSQDIKILRNIELHYEIKDNIANTSHQTSVNIIDVDEKRATEYLKSLYPNNEIKITKTLKYGGQVIVNPNALINP